MRAAESALGLTCLLPTCSWGPSPPCFLCHPGGLVLTRRFCLVLPLFLLRWEISSRLQPCLPSFTRRCANSRQLWGGGPVSGTPPATLFPSLTLGSPVPLALSSCLDLPTPRPSLASQSWHSLPFLSFLWEGFQPPTFFPMSSPGSSATSLHSLGGPPHPFIH